MLDVDALLAPVEGPSPCGPYLEYEPIDELERFAAGKGEQRLGDVVVPAEEPDWSAVRDRAVELFKTTKDLRVAVLLTRALVRTAQLAGLAEGLALVHGLLDRYWDGVHPPLAIDGEHDPHVRMNVLATLADHGGLVRDVRNAWLVPGAPLVRVTVREALVAAGKQPPAQGETVRAIAGIAAAIAASVDKNRANLEGVVTSLRLARAIVRLVQGKEEPDVTLNLGALADTLAGVAPLCESAIGTPAASQGTNAQCMSADGTPMNGTPMNGTALNGTAPNGAQGGAANGHGWHGEVLNREEAIRQLDSICSFFERTEPGNPAPLFIRRGQRMLNKSFVDIIRELAPDSLNRIEDIAGLKKGDAK
ncbi:type VI secretion system protein TssA [Pseudoduganella sp. SL102]|uniref:type VI secretion system protein TssA n=1 Tax=Pseudoduganella sp. SL102 TaxID=2995154 RepID=UPI00248AC7E7|nr:type VI secretion system protein TssA [Pseudoduganella sp. SL102]WBS00602.1 type VI secretion system protein TssA [Pseudoduganella sp. SL102]